MEERHARVLSKYNVAKLESADRPGKGMVFHSRFTPGLETAEDVALEPGMQIEYLLEDGTVIRGEITSRYVRHSRHGGSYGWECSFQDGVHGFADERRVVDWPDRVS